MPPRLLVADDDPEWRALVSLWLKGAGYEVGTVSCGRAALDWAAKNEADCFILDYEMGDMTGGEVCRRLKEAPGTKDTPVVILTTLAAKMLEAAGAKPDYFVVKRDSSDELLAVLGGIFTPGR